VDRHSTGHNQQPDQLNAKGRVSHCARQMVVIPATDWLSDKVEVLTNTDLRTIFERNRAFVHIAHEKC